MNAPDDGASPGRRPSLVDAGVRSCSSTTRVRTQRRRTAGPVLSSPPSSVSGTNRSRLRRLRPAGRLLGPVPDARRGRTRWQPC
ncbi:hypothetical protein HBB16_20125 [Pseudonocardia sp. MCCB 268]|nr:hypothetical protein [Pseudonocardia cytotoxica]